MSHLARYLVGAIGGALLLYLLAFDGPDLSPYRDPIIVSHRDLVRGEPDTVVRFVDRLVNARPAPIVVEVALGSGVPDIQRFCAPSVVSAIDTAAPAPADTMLLLRSVVWRRGWFLQPDRVTAIGPTSVGDLERAEYRMRGGSLRASGDSLIARTPRLGLAKQLLEAGVYAGIGYAVGKVF